MAQYGFYINMNECASCKACVIACKDVNDLEEGFNFRHVEECEGGSYPDVWAASISLACNHCATPACFAVCPVGAITKDEETGLVSIDPEECTGCQSCVSACPYGAPVHVPDKQKVGKCDGCMSKVAEGEKPACAAACYTRCLDFGKIEELEEKYGTGLVRTVPGLADPDQTSPSLLINPKQQMLA